MKLPLQIAYLSIVVFVFLLAACGVRAQPQRQSNDFAAAADYSRRARGLAMIVWKDGKVIFEDYQNGHRAELPWMLASGTKSFSGVLLAAAIEDGIIGGFDERVSDTIGEWKSDPLRSKITFRQLLSLTSGIGDGNIGRPAPYSEAIKSKASFPPGEKFRYGPTPFQVFGEALRRKLSKRNDSVYAYLRRRILDPISLSPSKWEMQEGQPNLPSGAYMTAREWLKFGEFMLNGGRIGKLQIIKGELLDELLKGSAANPNYGVTFWLNRGKADPSRIVGPRRSPLPALLPIENSVLRMSLSGLGDGAPADLFMAAGAANQRLYIIPSLRVIVVRMGRQAEFDDSEFLRLLLNRPQLKNRPEAINATGIH